MRAGWKRKTLVVSVTLAALATAAFGVAWHQNTYDIHEEQVTIPGRTQPLTGVLALPEKDAKPYGLVVFVHGDGPVDATHDGFYRPLWEAFARAGYASLSWNKPGVGGAPGNWLDQSMDDRAAETEAAITWARNRPDIDASRIGLWGASQAGWVAPKVAKRNPSVAFLIEVGPAINWLRQGRYNLLTEAADEKLSPAQTSMHIERSDATRKLLADSAAYSRYRAEIGGDITQDRWGFILKNYRSDASADLNGLKTPTLLVLGGQDRNVDVDETETTYRQLLAGTLNVCTLPQATHEGTVHGRSQLDEYARAAFAPRSLFAPNFLACQEHFLRSR